MSRGSENFLLNGHLTCGRLQKVWDFTGFSFETFPNVFDEFPQKVYNYSVQVKKFNIL